jgi:hypothetical protein
MVFAQLKGGLGNQMFQYAAGRRLAEKHHTDLLLDLSKIILNPANEHEKYGLHHFNINAQTAPEAVTNPLYAQNIYEKTIRKIKKITGIQKIKEIDEKQWFVFDNDILLLPDNVFLCGYWQSEKYFIDIENIIRNEFTLSSKLTKSGNKIANEIQNKENTVSMHIRRGDYVLNGVFDVCRNNYYYDCLSKLDDNIGNFDLYIFSDDIKWVINNFNFNQSNNPHPNPPNTHTKPQFVCHFVDYTDEKYAYEDMYLMSLCKHNIIANSSYSWWGAWLNTNKDKKVFAPKNWTKDKTTTSLDIIPDNWIIV